MRELLILNLPSIYSTNYLEVPSEAQPFSNYLTGSVLTLFSIFFSSATLLTIFGGRVRDLKSVLIDEKLPEGWESRVRSRWGLTFAKFNLTVLPLEFSISEKKYRAKLALQQQSETSQSQEALNAPQS